MTAKCLDFQRFQLEFKDLVMLGNVQRFGGGGGTSWEKMHPDSETQQCKHNTQYQRGEGGGHLISQAFQ